MRSPPRKLRHELERQRARGRSFAIAWPISLNVALAGLSPFEAAWWRSVFAEQASYWKANFSGPNLTVPLFVPEREHDECAGGVLVA